MSTTTAAAIKGERVTLPLDVVPSHYALELTPDIERLEFTASEQINVSVAAEGSVCEVTLHCREIQVESAFFQPSATSAVADSIVAEEMHFNVKYHTVKFVFASALPVGEGVLHFKYRGILNGDMAGFYKSTYANASGEKKVMASTQFEALDARRAFLCWDEPAVKATFAVTLIIPAHLTALSNMPETSTQHLPAVLNTTFSSSSGSSSGGGMLKRVSFETTPKMSTYLLAWAVGEFDFVQATTRGGVQIRVYSPPGRAQQGSFALDVAVRSLDLYDDFFRLPYPLPKLDMLCVTEFAMGAMENWGLVTYREVDLMIDAEKASSQQKQRVATVVAHELAHQWFGNLVTMSWWDGLWLNEGFAAWMQHFAVDAVLPEYKMWEQYTTDAFSAAQRLDALRSSHPVIVPIKHAEEVEQVFDAISYCKGSTVVNMVAAIVGKEKFQEGLQLYMQRHKYGNTETVDLWNAWSAASGKDIAQLMRTWTTVTGYPYLQVLAEKWTDTQVEVTLQQARFLADGSSKEGEEEEPLWSIPLVFATAGSLSQEAVIMDQKIQSFCIPVAAAAADSSSSGSSQPWLRINAGQKALARVSHSSEMIARLKAAIAADKTAVSDVDKAALLLDAYALAKAGLAPLVNVVEVLRALQEEEGFVVWNAIAGVLGGLRVLLEQLQGAEAAFKEFTAFGKALVVKALAKVGWDPKEGDGHTDKLLRGTVIGLLDTFAWDDAAVAAEARRRFDLHWAEPAVLPSEYKTTVYRIVIKNGGLAEYEAVLKAFESTEDNQERKYAMFSLGSTADKALKMRTLDWAMKSGQVKTQDMFYPLGAVAGGLQGAEMVWKYFQDNFQYIKEKLSKASPSLMAAVIVNSISHFCTAQKADEIEAFFAANPLPQSARRISQSLENMRSTAQMLAAVAKSPLAEAAYW